MSLLAAPLIPARAQSYVHFPLLAMPQAPTASENALAEALGRFHGPFFVPRHWSLPVAVPPPPPRGGGLCLEHGVGGSGAVWGPVNGYRAEY